MVKANVCVLQPETNVGAVFGVLVYVLPFPAVQVYVSQAETVVVPVVLGVMVKFNVCVLQPETNVGAVVGVLVYVFPFPADQV